MGNYAVMGNARLFGVALVGLTVIALLSGGEALAAGGVGVTSAADGDPLGKPPNENERILRIGIDVQANELITTSTNDRAHLVFLDGSSLTVGPDARVTIDRFVFDPNTQNGELAINATRGVFRLVGGKISKNAPITITTPSSTIGIRGGITIVSVTQVQTVAGFVFGKSMTVTAGGKTTTASRAGTQITVAGGVLGAAVLFKPGSLTAALSQLEGASPNNNNSPDQSVQKSGFSNKNSGQPANAPNFNQNQPPNTSNNTLTNAVSFSNPAGQPVGNSTLQNQAQNTTTTTTTTPISLNNNPINTPNNNPINTPNNNPINTPNNNPINTPNNNPINTPNNTPTGPQTSQTLTGFAGGLVVIDQPGGEGTFNSRRVLLLSQPGSISIATDAANNQAKGTLVVSANGSQQSGTAALQLSGTRNSTLIAMANDPTRPSTLQIGGSTFQINANTALVSLSNPSSCTCEFLNWGLWASSAPDPRNNGTTYTAVGTYVAGTIPAVQLPTMGSATYNGFMAGFAQGGGNAAPYLASGSYQNAWNFQTRTGAFNGSFDGRSYSGTTQATGGAGSTTFGGNFSGGSRSGSLNGAFFASPSDAAKYQAGTFSIGNNGSGYRASGIFAGQR